MYFFPKRDSQSISRRRLFGWHENRPILNLTNSPTQQLEHTVQFDHNNILWNNFSY